MNGVQFNTVFEDFVKRLVLTKTQKNRIDTTLDTAQSIFNNVDAKMQGSFATGTTAKPLTDKTSKDGKAGEYDADIALLSNNWQENSAEALDTTRSILTQHYGEKVDNKKRNVCERVYFSSDETGVTFHADFVPLRRENPTKRADRKSRRWQESRTFEVIDRYIAFDKQNNYASSCLLILKRLRDYADLGQSLPSIFLLAIILNHYQERESYRDDLISLCDAIIDIFRNTKQLIIKSANGLYNLTENLVDNVKDVDQIVRLLNSFKVALSNLSLDTLEDMQSLLSIDFPTEKRQYPIQMDSLRTHGLAYDTRNGLSTYEIVTSDHSNNFYRIVSRGMEFLNPVKIKFTVSNHRDLNAGRDLAARWRITNDPTKVPEDVRGKLQGRGRGNEFIHLNETAKYEGVHRAEVFVMEREGNKIIGTGRYKVKKIDRL